MLWWRLLWLSATLAAVGAMVLPLSNFQGHSHWAKVNWIPFGERPFGVLDAFENVLLFMPFGWCGVLSRRGGSGALTVQTTILALLLSVSGELFQVYCHNRLATTTDVCTNTFGALLGAAIAARFAGERSVNPPKG
jgi:glycopeptide antibiotics resistance protein